MATITITTTATVCESCVGAAYDHLRGGRNIGYFECVETACIYGAGIDHFYDCDSRADPDYDGPCDCACNRSEPDSGYHANRLVLAPDGVATTVDGLLAAIRLALDLLNNCTEDDEQDAIRAACGILRNAAATAERGQ